MLVIRHELFQCVVDHTQQELSKKGITKPAAKEIAESVADRLAEAFGGQNICFPKDASRMRRERDAQMIADFNGHNYAELASRYGMAERSVRRVLARLKQRTPESHQQMPKHANGIAFAS